MKARHVLLLWGPVIAWMALIFYISSINTWTTGEGPPSYQALRKAGHVFEYSILALLIGRALMATWAARGHAITRQTLIKVWQIGVILSTLYAISDEIHQAFVPRREFHLTDILIDALSATAALGIWYIVRARRLSRRNSDEAAWNHN